MSDRKSTESRSVQNEIISGLSLGNNSQTEPTQTTSHELTKRSGASGGDIDEEVKESSSVVSEVYKKLSHSDIVDQISVASQKHIDENKYVDEATLDGVMSGFTQRMSEQKIESLLKDSEKNENDQISELFVVSPAEIIENEVKDIQKTKSENQFKTKPVNKSSNPLEREILVDTYIKEAPCIIYRRNSSLPSYRYYPNNTCLIHKLYPKNKFEKTSYETYSNTARRLEKRFITTNIYSQWNNC